MNKYFKISLLALIIFGFVILTCPSAAAFDPVKDTGLGAAQTQSGLPTTIGTGKASNFPDLIGELIGVGLSLFGIIFFLLMLYGGFYWMIARGDTSKVDKAKEILEAAIIGLIIVTGSYAIANFIFSNLVG